MLVRVFHLCVLLLGSTSCEFISKNLKVDNVSQLMDTVIDLNHVDVFPSFKACDTLIAIALKNQCFTNNLHTHLTSSLLAHTFTVNESIDDVVRVHLKIDKEGASELIRVVSSQAVKEILPELDTLIIRSVESLPTVFPALKRGIPVTTIYEIPIVVKMNTK